MVVLLTPDLLVTAIRPATDPRVARYCKVWRTRTLIEQLLNKFLFIHFTDDTLLNELSISDKAQAHCFLMELN